MFVSAVMWNVYGDCDNFATLKGHSGAVMELHYNTDGRSLYSPTLKPFPLFKSILSNPKT